MNKLTKRKISIVSQSLVGIILLIGSIAFSIYCLNKSTDNQNIWIFISGFLSYPALALILMIWMGLMSLIKLKKADFYHDRENKMWILRLLILFIFIASGLLTSINLFYDNSVQILLIGYFFLVNSVLDTISPLVEYISRGIYENNK